MSGKREFTGYDIENLPRPTPEEVDALVNQLKKLLRGKGPFLQSAALADVVSMFFAANHPDFRDAMLVAWINTMRQLIAVNEKALLEQYGGKWPDRPKSNLQ